MFTILFRRADDVPSRDCSTSQLQEEELLDFSFVSVILWLVSGGALLFFCTVFCTADSVKEPFWVIETLEDQ